MEIYICMILCIIHNVKTKQKFQMVKTCVPHFVYPVHIQIISLKTKFSEGRKCFI